jgi:hypothetical protein
VVKLICCPLQGIHDSAHAVAAFPKVTAISRTAWKTTFSYVLLGVFARNRFSARCAFLAALFIAALNIRTPTAAG